MESQPSVDVETYKTLKENEITEAEDGESPSVQSPRKSKKARTTKVSTAWEHFNKIGTESNPRAACKYCGITYACDTQRNGTTNLLKHIESKCKKFPGRVNDNQQKILTFVQPKEEEGSSNLIATTFSQEKCRMMLSRLIVKEELPFKIVEAEGFKEYSNTLQPKFVLPGRMTVAKDIWNLYLSEKKDLKRALTQTNQRVCLTTDTWTSIQNLNYMVVTANFIDDDWRYHKRILNFCLVANHRGDTIGKCLEKCMLDWGIERILTVTVDNASSNDGAVSYLARKVKNWNGDILNGEFMHVRCFAHILNLVVNDGLKELHESILKIRNAVRYVRSSPSRLATFKRCVKNEKLSYKSSVSLDVPTRWNSTYTMLSVAETFEKAFDRLEVEDEQYIIELSGSRNETETGTVKDKDRGKKKGPPVSEDWDNARVFIKFLKIFRDMTLRISGSSTLTAHRYFREICVVQKQLQVYLTSDNILLTNMAKSMKFKYEKYWGNSGDKTNFLLYVATVLDPRFKLKFVLFSLSTYFGDDDPIVVAETRRKVECVLRHIFEDYKSVYNYMEGEIENKKAINLSKNKCGAKDVDIVDVALDFTDFLDTTDDVESKSELDRYLSETCERGDDDVFNILDWWKQNSHKYRILSKMAKDILAIPLSTVASESAFSTGGRVLDPSRSTLSPTTVETLICLQNWIRSSPISNIEEIMEGVPDEIAKVAEESQSTSSGITTIDD